MEVCNPKGGRTATPAFLAMLLMMMIMMLLNAYCCGASVLVKSNTSFRCSDGRLDECLIEEDLELELGFLMNPYVSRILGSTSRTKQALERGKPVIRPCGQSQDPAYDKCIAPKVKPSKDECHPKINAYKRCPP
ncbi:hypothetical protein I3843_03G116400 [Carya illinoinensis]|uniref:Uncharacterized protein n=1 Tax=Carya illinoinensis TaxID=32201 RepID=A0A922IV33_CARIL|nr:hypothetical protein I3842_13G159800 [Carya illinoinensis]KAG7987113.1 hypothetical protein I3843_03G116400 [Carya illinoinensis]